MENKDFLLLRLELASALNGTDKAAVTAAAEKLNAITADLDEDQKNHIRDNIINAKIIETATVAINALNLITNKESYIKYMELVVTSTITTDYKIYLNAEVTFDNSADEFRYYSLLVSRIIVTSNSELIKSAIEKLQSL